MLRTRYEASGAAAPGHVQSLDRFSEYRLGQINLLVDRLHIGPATIVAQLVSPLAGEGVAETGNKAIEFFMVHHLRSYFNYIVSRLNASAEGTSSVP